MLDIKLLRENPVLVRNNIIKKGEDAKLKLLDELLELDEKWRKLKYSIDQLKSERNKLSKEINITKKKGGDISEIIKKAKNIPDKIKSIEEEAEELNINITLRLYKIPNIMHKDVPKGKDDSENIEIKKIGKIIERDFEVVNHVELCEKNNWADFDVAATNSGNGFYYLKGDLALLNQALIRYTLEFMHNKDYVYVEPPLMLRKKILSAAIDVEELDNTIYKIKDEDLNLIATSEHPMLGLLADKVISYKELPLKYFSYSMCFRKEIGSHGINEKGLWRTHQFNKVEQFIFAHPNKSWELYEELLRNSEEILQNLELPYRVVEICTGDLGLWKARSADIEIYRPTTKEYGEVMSLSNCTDFQARDLNIKVLQEDNSRDIVHTLNNTAMATSRILVAILENYQNKDGSINIPQTLQKYMFGKKKLIAKN